MNINGYIKANKDKIDLDNLKAVIEEEINK